MQATIGQLTELIVQRLSREENTLLQRAALRQISRFRRDAKHLLNLGVALPDPPKKRVYPAKSSGTYLSRRSEPEVEKDAVDTTADKSEV